ncbi:neprilysin-1-like isoform X3 [Dermacentor silvarum]|uniref:neprilysin-1-like isoform X3 n=1 Tax=Dermacentor silvarum TaxID=543639 RepID=UPI00210112DD|nr:neprilysin-1-like isoform X3 [Dermacentor silvarum]
MQLSFQVEDIARSLIQAFNETLQNNSWIGNTTREALEKVLKVPLEIGYPDALLNMSVLEAFYKYVPYFPSNISFTEAFYYFQENLYKMKLRKFRHPEESNWRSVHSPRERRSTFHEKYGIDIEIPYPIFVSPFFQRGLPRSLNYGGIGGTIARELGSTFSIDGMSRIQQEYKTLVSNQFPRTFRNNASCLEQKYKAANNETLREHHLDRQVPQIWPGADQALADNTGLQIAFKAYCRVLEDVERRLTGLENITGMQLFFISNARTQCRITHTDTLYDDIAVRWPYTPARNRVNEAMKNLEAFAKAFKCSLGSHMYSNKTCSWL